ncbi:MAG: cyclic pyranopterin monophosphate synthase MoaC [Alphaproteobacteria bacterium]|nr:cyclic pyranopterin monophosphate synthase MoaC [Alphaproteobacteria bacterium]
MVDVSEKAPSRRQAVAEARISMSAEAFAAITQGRAPKGDVLAAARIAGILAAKRTPELIPLCHPLPLTGAEIEITPEPEASTFRIRSTVRVAGRTGVEMEALTAAAVAALTLYDMAKALDRGMEIGGLRLIEKAGGRSGHYKAPVPRKDKGR